MQKQLELVLDMQVIGGQSLRRDVDRVRDEVYSATNELRNSVEMCANADAVEDRDKQLVHQLNSEMMRS